MEIYIRWGKRTRADCAAELHKRLRTIAVPLHREMRVGGVRRSRAACGQARKALQDGAKRGLEPLLTGLTECLKVTAGWRLHAARPARAETGAERSCLQDSACPPESTHASLFYYRGLVHAASGWLAPAREDLQASPG